MNLIEIYFYVLAYLVSYFEIFGGL